MVVLHAVGANHALPLGDDHRQVRAQPLDVAKRVQEVAAEFDLLFLAVRRPDDVRIAEQLDLAAVAVGEGLAGIGDGDDAVVADRADARLVDLERVVVGKVAQPLAFDLGAQGAVAAEALDHEASHRVVGLVAQRCGLARGIDVGRIANQPPGPRRQHRHHEQR